MTYLRLLKTMTFVAIATLVLASPVEKGYSIKQFLDFVLYNSEFSARVIHYWPNPECGIFATASQSIVVRNKADTARIIMLCDDNDVLKPGTEIVVKPEFLPEFNISMVGDDSRESNAWFQKNLTTYFGIISVLKN